MTIDNTTAGSLDWPRYKCHKIVAAARIEKMVPIPELAEVRLELTACLAPWVVDAEWAEKHRVTEGGYLVRYEDGYLSFSPAKAFTAGYTALG